ncbi:MSHA biogenesis protein MshI [Colwellia sp. BRX9-1]|uniref:MSHA biogenesis protein MshI n=1 Tax=Colwellia sp. BRX9-1 TaxID=2759830 RepID=UPI0015F671B5|nr:MSHA biogenesis protein MshI [Colwellia sp. BRX9-1]MBA6352314.1 MSHA biogenesis protein MshI [Colwellia sp. BRX9-1]
MSLIKKINNFFSKVESKDLLGVSLHQHSFAFFFCPEQGESQFQQINSSLAEHPQQIKIQKEKYQLQGQCHLVLASSQTQILQVDKPNIPDNELNAALKWQIKDLVNHSPEDMVLDYFDGPTLSGGNEKINVVCASKKELLTLIGPLNQDGLILKSITTEEFAFASLLPVKDDACLMVCQQPNEEIILLIVKQGKVFFSRRLRGFAQIATKTEEELSFGIVDNLNLEIQRSTDYFERQLKQAPIRSIEVIVPMANEALLARKLAENTNVAVNLFTMPEGFNHAREFAVSLGATKLNNMEPIK